jgi:DNA-binding CsgD family transcriptional regulator
MEFILGSGAFSMSLSFRIAQPADFSRCQALLSPLMPAVYSPEVWHALPRLWTQLCAEHRLEIHVFEDTARPADQRIFCLASGVFVVPDFAASLLTRPRPFLADEVYRRELAGDSIILSPAAAAHANARDGVDAIGLDYAVERLRWTDLAGLRVVTLIPESLRVWCGGYRLNSLHRELFEREMHFMARAAGLRRRRPLKSTSDAQGTSLRLRPALFGLTREEAMAAPGTATSMHFVYDEPAFDFTPAQKDLLRLALLGQSDAEAATALGVSPSTVKKHWQAVFERVASIGPSWMPQESIGSPDGKRGVEKRRHLLNYLRRHLEEIRPRA